MRNRVEEFRERLGLKQKDLAVIIGVTQPTISNIESGKKIPSVELAIYISRALDSTVEELFIVPESE